MRMKIMFIALLLASSSPAFAEEPETQPTVIYQKKTLVEFSELAIQGETAGPNVSRVDVRTKARFRSFIRLRGDFRPELLRSVEDL